MKTFRTKREAETAAAEWRLAIDRGTSVDSTRMTLGAYLAHWLETTIHPSVRPSTYTSYEMLIRVHIVPDLGNVPLQRLSALHLQRFYAAKLRGGRVDGKPGGLASRTVQYLHGILNQALRKALATNLISRNVAATVTPPRRTQGPLQIWDAVQVRAFLDAAEGDGYAPVWLLALTTGMRIGELLGLRWRDVDLARGTLSVRQAATAVGSRIIVGPPKSPASRRTIALSASAVRALREHRARQTEHRWRIDQAWQDHDLVLASKVGTHISSAHITNRMDALVRKAGVPRIRFHDLRHTHASLLLLKGVNVKVVSERLGHSSVRITLDTYAHVLPQMQRGAAEAIDEALFTPAPLVPDIADLVDAASACEEVVKKSGLEAVSEDDAPERISG